MGQSSAESGIGKPNRGRTRTAKQRMLTQGEPSHASGIADAVVIKDEEVYFLCQSDGVVPFDEGHGLGLYFHDCRFLSAYELRVAGELLEPLAANGDDGFRSLFQLTNPRLEVDGHVLNRQRIGVRWRHVVDGPDRALRDEVEIENYDTDAYVLPLTLSLDADFRDVFVIRGIAEGRPGELRRPRWDDDELVLSYRGGDERLRELRIRFSEKPAWTRGGHVGFELRLGAHEATKLVVSMAIVDSAPHTRQRHSPREALDRAEAAFERSIDDWMKGFARVRSSSLWVERAIHRSLRDLRALRMTWDRHQFLAAGVPWFATLFGRDSLLCAVQTLAYRRELAADTLRLLAQYQGKTHDAWRDEEPGKILHEMRVGELAHLGLVPHTPYYGTVDATPLFLVLLGEYTRWAGELSLFWELQSSVDAALRWIDHFADHDGDGFTDYTAASGDRLINQGWKDSGNAIVDAGGRLAEPPIALVEVQGYVFLAKRSIAELFERSGDGERAQRLRREAAALRERFNREFWCADKEYYALALQRGGRAADAISSNPGQALWTGIIDERRVRAVVDRLMSPAMYSGWGIRTLSADERAYNPVGYHRGTVWPHDNALIVAGMRRHGCDEEARRVFGDLLEAATYFEDYRLPETFAGYGREQYGVPVRYPVACHPQAWASGAIPFMLQVLLGVEPDAFSGRLFVRRPALPSFVDRLEWQGLRVGGSEVDLTFSQRDGQLSVEVTRRSGELEVIVER